MVIQGTDGLYYKLNTDGMKTTAEQTEYNSLNGSILMAKSVTAEKVNVHDLVAFDATIGGFNITDYAIYSGVKNNVNAGARGTYIDKEGQIAFGDSNSYLKYYKDADGNWKLEVSASSVKFTTANKTLEDKLNDIDEGMKSTIVSVTEEYAVADSTSDSPQTGWTTETPKWEDGKFIWRRQLTTYGDGHTDYSAPALMTGNSGTNGEDAVTLRIESSRGTVFKNDQVATMLSVVIYSGSKRITNSKELENAFGSKAYLQWEWQRLDDDSFGIISAGDPRFGDKGFTFKLSPNDVDTKVTFMCKLIM